MFKINNVIDLRAKFEESTYIRLEEETRKKKKREQCNQLSPKTLVETESTCSVKSGIQKLTSPKKQFLS